MKPFWKKPGKKKSKNKPKPVRQKKESALPRERPKLWVPPQKRTDAQSTGFERPAKKTEPDIDNADHKKEFLSVFQELTYQNQKGQIWSDFITMFACSISNVMDQSNFEEREKLYMDIVNRYNKKDQFLFPKLSVRTVMALEENPEQDFLGSIFMELGLGNEYNGQFFTPYHVCQLMASATMQDIGKQVEQDGYVSINDPCCGAGATLIAGINEARRILEKEGLNFQNHILIVGQDIDYIATLMCYIQVSLLGVAGYFKVGNSLTEPMTPSDTMENYWFTPIYFTPVWQYRRLYKRLDSLMKKDGDSMNGKD